MIAAGLLDNKLWSDEGKKATTAAELESAIRPREKGSPYLVDARIACIGAGAESTWHEDFKLSQRMKASKV